MYEGNTQKLDWSSVELVCKCFSDKEKELFLEKEFICLNNLYVVNGKFDHHKTIIENGNEGSQ